MPAEWPIADASPTWYRFRVVPAADMTVRNNLSGFRTCPSLEPSVNSRRIWGRLQFGLWLRVHCRREQIAEPIHEGA
jgi:hypothetical protein